MPPLPKAGAQLELDTSQWDSAYKGVMADAGKLDALDPTITVSVSDAEIKSAINLAADLDTSTSLKVNVDDSELTTVSDQLDDIATIGIIDLAINVAGNAQSFIEGLGRFSGIAGLMEMDSALAMIQARTGKMIPDVEHLINDLYVNGWGESKTQIAEVVAQAAQLGLEGADLEAAVLSTLQVVSVTGGDATETLNKLDTASKANGITFTETADLFVAGFQSGNDKADDLLDTLSEYSTQFASFGLSAEGALAFIDSGLNQGVFNTDVLADSVKELGLRLDEVGTTPAITDAFKILEDSSDVDLTTLLDGYQAGEDIGDEMLEGIIASLADLNAVDPAQASLVTAALFGTQSEVVTVDIWTKLTTDADTAFGDIEGRAEEAGNTISDTLGVTVDTFLRNIEQMATSFLESDAIDLDGKIETFKNQLQTAMTTAMEGGSIGEVFEAGFGITGIDTALANIGRVFGQFTITLLEIVAAIQDPLGINDADKATRGQITTMATAQLPFDLSVANPEEFDAIFKQAAQRGVSSADLGAALNTALDASVASGDFERTKAILAEILADPTVDPTAAQTLVDKYTTAIDEAMAAATPPTPPPNWTAGFSGLNPLMPKAGSGGGKAFAGPAGAGAKGMEWWDTIEVSPETIESLNNASTAVTTLDTDVNTAMTNASLVTTLASDEMITALSAMSDGVVTADEEIAMAITGNTMTTSFDAMSTSAEENAATTKTAFMGILATVSLVDSRMADFFYGVMAKIGAANAGIEGIGTVPTTPGGGGGNTTVNNVNVSTTNNVQSNAQAAAAGYQIAASIRGMA